MGRKARNMQVPPGSKGMASVQDTMYVPGRPAEVRKVWELNPMKKRDPNASAGVRLFHSSKEVCESRWSEGNSK